MGLIAAALNAAGGTLASQWREYFYVESLPDNVLATKAEKRVNGRFGGSRHEDDNVISDGSVIAVADGQCMMIVDQGKIVDFCAEPGEYVFEPVSYTHLDVYKRQPIRLRCPLPSRTRWNMST